MECVICLSEIKKEGYSCDNIKCNVEICYECIKIYHDMAIKNKTIFECPQCKTE